ncbi:MAG: ribonuclease P protein component [Planctomycetia bacterium]|nr:ribonuclease P protein component [Planctomycetia bacterium]
MSDSPPVSWRHPKDARLRLERDFAPLRRGGRRFTGAEATFRILPNDRARPRLGIATPRQYGSAVRRNRFRRLLREAFRRVAAELAAVDLLGAPRRDLREPSLDGLVADLLRAAGRRAP